MAKPINISLLLRFHPWEVISILYNLILVVVSYAFLIKAGVTVSRTQYDVVVPKAFTFLDGSNTGVGAQAATITGLSPNAFSTFLDAFGILRTIVEEKTLFWRLDGDRSGVLNSTEIFGVDNLDNLNSLNAQWPLLSSLDALKDSQRRKLAGHIP